MRLQVLVPTLLLGLPATAHAWQIDDPIHHNCHERITFQALQAAGYVQPPRDPTGTDAQLSKSTEFDPKAYDQNLYALSLILGARYPDLHGVPDFSFGQLATVHNAPGDQDEHCLRSQTQDGPEGNVTALRDCRKRIEALYWSALGTLDAAGGVDPDERVPAPLNTQYQGTIQYPVSQYYWFAGRGLHAIQDSFTHTFRTPDQHKVQHVFDWVEQVACTLDEARDGHGHESVLDNCEHGDETVKPRFDAAVLASTQFLQLLREPGDKAARQLRIDQFLDSWFTFEPGCTMDNGYCGNTVAKFLDASPDSSKGTGICQGCGACPQGTQAPIATVLTVLAGVLVAWRWRRGSLASLLLCAGLLAHRPAEASELDRGYRTEVHGSLSVANPAYALQVNGAYAFKRFEIGGLLELNPWMSIERRSMSLGATNAAVFVHFKHKLRPDLWWRAGLALGLSVLNDEQVGTHVGKTGAYLNLKGFGLVWQFDEDVALVVDVFDLAIAAPQLTGWPLVQPQSRFSIGLQF
jgi:hypothetical protein